MRKFTKMTIFFRIRNLEIVSGMFGEKDLSTFNMDLEDAEQIYGYAIFDLDEYIMSHIGDFKLVKQEESYVLVIKDDIKENVQKYLN